MTNTTEIQKSSPDEEYIEEVLAQLGGVGTLREGADDFRETVTRMWGERDALTEKYPDMWVAMGKDGVVSVGNSIEEVLSAAETAGVSNSDVVVEFLDANPRTLIL